MYEITKAKIFCRAVKSQQNCNRNESPISSKQNIIKFYRKTEKRKDFNKKIIKCTRGAVFPGIMRKSSS